MIVASKEAQIMDFADKLRLLRERTGKSQKDLAALLGRHQSRVSKWEAGTGDPTPGDLLVISRYFSVPLQYLCDETLEDPDSASEQAERDFLELLPEQYRVAWSLVRRLGHETALDRLMALPPLPAPGTPVVRPLSGIDLSKASNPASKK